MFNNAEQEDSEIEFLPDAGPSRLSHTQKAPDTIRTKRTSEVFDVPDDSCDDKDDIEVLAQRTRSISVVANTSRPEVMAPRQKRKRSHARRHKFTERSHPHVVYDNGKVKWAGVGDPYRTQRIGGQGKRLFWSAVRLNGHVITSGDMVTCKTTTRAGERANNGLGLVRWFSQQQEERYCHVQWLSTSVCGEEDELFLEHRSCEDVRFGLIFSSTKIAVQQPMVKRVPFVNHVYDRAYNTWRDPIVVHLGLPACDSCIAERGVEATDTLQRHADGFSLGHTAYHEHEFVLIDSEVMGKPWLIGQIVAPVPQHTSYGRGGGSYVVTVRMFKRYSELESEEKAFISCYQLVITDEERAISLDHIVGKTFVSSSPHSGSFFCIERIPISTDAARLTTRAIIPLQRGLRTCKQCFDAYRIGDDDFRTFSRISRCSLPAIDYYSGGGGGVIGGRQAFHYQHALEMNPVACETLRRNNPGIKVHCGMVSELSDAARRDGSGALPVRGSMIIALAGPPCQGHSGANRFPDPDDPRNGELFIIIKEIQRLQPDIFILENVPGMKRDKEDSDRADSHGTRNFAVEAIKGLRAIGYQCRLVLLDSRSFGSPQNRVRLFILCARKGVPLPSFPEPSHANPDLRRTLLAIEETGLETAFYVGSKGVQGGGGVYPPITSTEAISDLPPFEYRRPGEQRARCPPAIPTFSPGRSDERGNDTRIGFNPGTPYASQPKNEYQKGKRGASKGLVDHYTPARSQRELDIIFDADLVVGQKSDRDVPGTFRRMNPHGAASTLLTDSAPGGRYTGPVHFSQRRTLTVAERKRIQGVPDSYRLWGTILDKDAQLGNMINVDVSAALHTHIAREVFYPAWVKAGRPADFFKVWRDLHPVT